MGQTYVTVRRHTLTTAVSWHETSSNTLERTIMINLNGRRFTLVSNSAGDAAPGQTLFTFEQNGRAVRATYEGGGVQLGALVGQIEPDDVLTVLFQQVTSAGKLCGGEGRMEVERCADGKLRFVDLWKFTINGEGSGRAVWQEF